MSPEAAGKGLCPLTPAKAEPLQSFTEVVGVWDLRPQRVPSYRGISPETTEGSALAFLPCC